MQKMRLMLFLLIGLLGFAAAPARAIESSLSLSIGRNTFTLPFKAVDATQLYSFKEGKGFPALQTVLYNFDGKVHAGIGAAPVIGTENAVPFVTVQFLLPKKAFDPAVGPIWIGLWAGKKYASLELRGDSKTLWGLNASIALW